MDIEKAHRVLQVVGAEQFRQPVVAEEALEIAIEELEPGQDLIRVSFEIFMELLDDYGLLIQAFSAGIERIPFRYLLSRVPRDDAEEVAQIARISAWKSFRNFVALTPNSWSAWLFMITKRKLNSHFSDMYSDAELFEFYDIHPSTTVETDKRGWSIPEICTDWIETVPEDEKAAFAAQLLAMYQGQSGWVGPTGTRMCTLIGLDKSAGSRTKLYRWWRQFIVEVEKREG